MSRLFVTLLRYQEIFELKVEPASGRDYVVGGHFRCDIALTVTLIITIITLILIIITVLLISLSSVHCI